MGSYWPRWVVEVIDSSVHRFSAAHSPWKILGEALRAWCPLGVSSPFSKE
jgi:hypothetical protein